MHIEGTTITVQCDAQELERLSARMFWQQIQHDTCLRVIDNHSPVFTILCNVLEHVLRLFSSGLFIKDSIFLNKSFLFSYVEYTLNLTTGSSALHFLSLGFANHGGMLATLGAILISQLLPWPLTGDKEGALIPGLIGRSFYTDSMCLHTLP